MRPNLHHQQSLKRMAVRRIGRRRKRSPRKATRVLLLKLMVRRKGKRSPRRARSLLWLPQKVRKKKKKKKSDADGEDVAVQTEASGKKDKKKRHADDERGILSL